MTKLSEQEQSLQWLFLCLRNRGYDPFILSPLFQELAISKAHLNRVTATYSDDDEERCFLHLTYHPWDPSSKSIQQVFRNTLLKPDGKPPLPHLRSLRLQGLLARNQRVDCRLPPATQPKKTSIPAHPQGTR